MEQKPGARDRNDRIQLAPMEKDGETLLKALDDGNMVAVLSGMEMMYVFIHQEQYQCFIHKFDAEEGRRRAFPIDERSRAMMKNLDSTADQLFEIIPQPKMNVMGVMVAAERGILAYLDTTGQLPAEDVDFMDWKETDENHGSEGG